MQTITPKKREASVYTLRNALHIVLHFMQCAEKSTDFPPIFAMWANKKSGRKLGCSAFSDYICKHENKIRIKLASSWKKYSKSPM